jgi:hypothetical protein
MGKPESKIFELCHFIGFIRKSVTAQIPQEPRVLSVYSSQNLISFQKALRGNLNGRNSPPLCRDMMPHILRVSKISLLTVLCVHRVTQI